MKKEEIEYALAKHIPAARDEITLHTNYGDTTLYGEDANAIAEKLKDVLEHKLNSGEYEE